MRKLGDFPALGREGVGRAQRARRRAAPPEAPRSGFQRRRRRRRGTRPKRALVRFSFWHYLRFLR
eukprot:3901603-Prymnesium_polylepis.2